MQKLTINFSPIVTIEIAAEKSEDLIRNAAFWQSLPTECQVCKSPLIFDYSTPKTFKYYKLKCTGPTPHCVNLSQKQDGSGMYFDRSKTWEVWRAGMTDEDSAERSAAEAMPDHSNAPGSERGELIATINKLAEQRRAEGKQINLKLDNLGERQTQGLKAMVDYLAKL